MDNLEEPRQNRTLVDVGALQGDVIACTLDQTPDHLAIAQRRQHPGGPRSCRGSPDQSPCNISTTGAKVSADWIGTVR
jgi:hypothetical protein